MSSLRLLLLLVVCVTVAVGEPLRQRARRETSSSFYRPVGSGRNLIEEAALGHALFSAPRGARLLYSQPSIPPLEDRLIDNATLIRANIVDTFRCDDRVYGYYADQDNDCQIFHVCLPLKQLFPANFTQPITYQFSFICPLHTIFSQDSMVCAWEEEALECEYAHELYWMNQNFFRKITNPDGKEGYAQVNSPLN
ncbi:uncharacterized protein LOC126998486 [Eriocheir sinensis]|uniref:uncharacterized protein LOC126998486 n=1 Tax=Eriocheir sinensis TaxID=95602 RepID=UPI0021C7532E|nr:uncharacterized protein LOC126998486 [Eriocheir sinensis]